MSKSVQTFAAAAVVGAAYGDEGKGLLTDALAAPLGSDGVVIRSNGGAQAGHTVELPDGRRHVFHHVGSGALAGAATFLSRFFVAHPIVLREELAALGALGVAPRLMIDPAAPVTIPFDMMINQVVERSRGAARHGSCGLGLGETMERSQQPGLVVRAGDLVDEPRLRMILGRVRATWVSARLHRLGVASLTEEERSLLHSEAIEERWLQDVAAFVEAVAIGRPRLAGRGIVFEGAQGLLLDQDRGAFPHVTRSNTGLKNMISLARDLGIGHLDIVYATRIYTTRHGAGPLAHAYAGAPYPGIVDRTNIANSWQGALRFAPLDLDLLSGAIRADLDDLGGSDLTHSLGLAVTCLDQVGRAVEYRERGAARYLSPEDVASAAADAVGAALLLRSRGPTRATIERETRAARFGDVRSAAAALPRSEALAS